MPFRTPHRRTLLSRSSVGALCVLSGSLVFIRFRLCVPFGTFQALFPSPALKVQLSEPVFGVQSSRLSPLSLSLEATPQSSTLKVQPSEPVFGGHSSKFNPQSPTLGVQSSRFSPQSLSSEASPLESTSQSPALGVRPSECPPPRSVTVRPGRHHAKHVLHVRRRWQLLPA